MTWTQNRVHAGGLGLAIGVGSNGQNEFCGGTKKIDSGVEILIEVEIQDNHIRLVYVADYHHWGDGDSD